MWRWSRVAFFVVLFLFCFLVCNIKVWNQKKIRNGKKLIVCQRELMVCRRNGKKLYMRYRTRFVGVGRMEVRDEFFCMFNFGGGKP